MASMDEFFYDNNTWRFEAADIASSSTSFLASPSPFLSVPATNWEMSACTESSLMQPSAHAMSSQLLLPGNNACHEVANIASSSTSFLASPSPFLSVPATNWEMSACTDASLMQPSAHAMSSQLLLPGNNACHEVANIASSSTSFLASPSPFLSVPATNWEMPTCTDASLMQPGAHAMSPQLLLPGNNACHEAANIASSSLNFLDSSSPFFSDLATNSEMPKCTDTSLMQPIIPTMPSELLSHNNMWVASSSRNFTASPSILPSNAEATTVSTTPSSANTCGTETWGARKSVMHLIVRALQYIMKTRKKTKIVMEQVTNDGYSRFKVLITGQPLTLNQGSGRLDDAWPRFGHAYYPRNSTLLPVFEKGNYSCLGFIEFVTIQTHTFFTDVNDICRALEVASLTTTETSSSPPRKFSTASYEEAIPEILQVLEEACSNHNLPLAQTWATCAQQGKQCKRHADENCISTINEACYVKDPGMQLFHEACSKHHLLSGQGVAGKAFTSNLGFSLPDIGSSSEQEYPLSNKAKRFNLKGAAAIRLRCTRTGMDFVLEFFLPTDCEVENEQNTVLDSLSETVESILKTLRVLTDEEIEGDAAWGINKKNKKANKRKQMARRSAVWEGYIDVIVGETVKCKYCGQNLCCDSKNGTSSLRAHLERWCKRNPNSEQRGKSRVA